MTIKHLVISGGGPIGLLTYGIASQLAKKGFWQLADIQSIYGCSVGAYLGVVLSLGYEWEWLDDYFIKRPWEKLIESSIINIIESNPAAWNLLLLVVVLLILLIVLREEE